MKLTTNNFFTHFFLLNHKHQDLDRKDQNKTLAYSVALGVFTLGLVHLGCLIIKKCIALTDSDNAETQNVDKLRESTFPETTGANPDKQNTIVDPKPPNKDDSMPPDPTKTSAPDFPHEIEGKGNEEEEILKPPNKDDTKPSNPTKTSTPDFPHEIEGKGKVEDLPPISFEKPIEELLNTLLPKETYPQGVKGLPIYPLVIKSSNDFDLDLVTAPVMTVRRENGIAMILITVSQEALYEDPNFPDDYPEKGVIKVDHFHRLLYPDPEALKKQGDLTWKSSSLSRDFPYFLQGQFTDSTGQLLNKQHDSFGRLQRLLREGNGIDDNGIPFMPFKPSV